jgi:hypothetical protein
MCQKGLGPIRDGHTVPSMGGLVAVTEARTSKLTTISAVPASSNGRRPALTQELRRSGRARAQGEGKPAVPEPSLSTFTSAIAVASTYQGGRASPK